MSRHARAALAAAVVVAAFALAPATAAERATLKVTARVVDRCTVEVPSKAPPGLGGDRKQPWPLVRHECQGAAPLRVEAARVLVEQLRARLPGDGRPELLPGRGGDGGRVVEAQHPTRPDVVLITITY
jgi:hypothetical protein